MVLLQGCDGREIKDLLSEGNDCLKGIFVSIQPWEPRFVAVERYVWLRCSGIPLHVWDSKFFKFLVFPLGSYIKEDRDTQLRNRYDIARVLIRTVMLGTIKKASKIKKKGRIFTIKMVEEPMGRGLFMGKRIDQEELESASEAASIEPAEKEGDENGDGDSVVPQPEDDFFVDDIPPEPAINLGHSERRSSGSKLYTGVNNLNFCNVTVLQNGSDKSLLHV